jgi:glycosyltransferase involved in cell wall biosynthesis
MICVVSVVDSISTTSMPVNEFVIYRSTHNYKMRQIMIVCDLEASNNVVIPDNVEVYLVGNDYRKIRKLVKKIHNECSGNVVYHMHHQKSAIIFLVATLFLGVRQHSLYTVHSTFNFRNLKYRISSIVCVLLANYANCVSRSAYHEYASIVKKIKGDHFIAIPNGVDVDRIDKIIERNPVKKDRRTLVCVGRMIPLKNHTFLIHLMKLLSDYRLILIGAEDKEGKVRALTKEEGVEERIEFKGLISRDDVFKELGKAAIYVSSSYVEGLPVSVLEAMRVGLFPIISDIMPHKEIAEHCKNVKVLPLNEQIWAKTIKQIDKLSYKEFIVIEEQIKASVQEQFSLDKMHEQYNVIYQKLA